MACSITSFCPLFGGSRVGMIFLFLCRFYTVENVRYLHWISLCFSECKNYQILSSADRKETNEFRNSLCDDDLRPGWFRFQGDAGTKMPTTCIPMRRCWTQSTGWLNGTHPEEYEGSVTRQVHFHWRSNCHYWSEDIQVKNCSGYYVYYLRGTKCNARYCSTD